MKGDALRTHKVGAQRLFWSALVELVQADVLSVDLDRGRRAACAPIQIRTAGSLCSGLTTTSAKALPIALATAGLNSSGTTPRTS